MAASLGVLLSTSAPSLGPSGSGTALAEEGPESPPAPVEPKSSRTEESLAVRGIYLQASTVEDASKLRDLIAGAQQAGINTFVADVRRSPAYSQGIATIEKAGLRYVPRVAVFPDGARRDQIDDRALLERRWRLIDHALKLGATDVQLDYIRFSSQNGVAPENASQVLAVIRFFRQRVQQRGARLQIDVFGEVSYGPSTRIGQDMRLFAPDLDAVCPMLYPSHFEPYRETAKAPYETVHGAILALERQIAAHPIPIYPYIEHFNYRHRMTGPERASYFEAQLEAVLNSGAQGFYIWSVGNHYDVPFDVLDRRARSRREPSPLAEVTTSTESGQGMGGRRPAQMP